MSDATLIAIILTQPVMINRKTLPPGTELEVEPELWADLQKWNAAELSKKVDASATDAAATLSFITEDQIKQLLELIPRLTEEQKTSSGKPKVEVLESAIGTSLSADERDLIFAAWQELNTTVSAE